MGNSHVLPEIVEFCKNIGVDGSVVIVIVVIVVAGGGGIGIAFFIGVAWVDSMTGGGLKKSIVVAVFFTCDGGGGGGGIIGVGIWIVTAAFAFFDPP